MSADQARRTAHAVHGSADAPHPAVDSLLRHRILGVLRDAPATSSQVARRLNLRTGSSRHHLRLLEQAGLIYVVTTRRLRGGAERYYAPAAHRGQPATSRSPIDVLRHALADPQSASQDERRLVRLQRARLGIADFEEVRERLETLLDGLVERTDPNEPVTTVAVALVRPCAAPTA